MFCHFPENKNKVKHYEKSVSSTSNSHPLSLSLQEPPNAQQGSSVKSNEWFGAKKKKMFMAEL